MSTERGNGKTLLVSYMFPPAGGVGVQRALALARYLPDAGCAVTVLTARNPVTHVYDPSLDRRLPASVQVHRTGALEPPYALRQAFKRLMGVRHPAPGPAAATAAPAQARTDGGVMKRAVKAVVERVIFPDPQKLWAKPALRQAVRLIEREQITSVLLTVPPFSLLCFAPILRQRFPALRIVLDFRDEWLEYHLQELDGTASEWKRRNAAELEQAAVSAADAVVTVTPPWVERLRHRYPQEPAGKFVYIPNGYDPESFEGFQPAPPAAPPLIVSYLGTLYANPVYSPRPYLDAVDAMGEEWHQRIETRFIGRVAPDAAPLLAHRRCRIVRRGFLPQHEAFQQLRGSHCLLLLLGTAGVHSGKLFEYLATGIPILAITPPEGEAARVLAETGAGYCAAPGDPAGIASALRLLYAHATGGGSQPGERQRNEEAIAVYSRARQASNFAQLLAPGGHRPQPT